MRADQRLRLQRGGPERPGTTNGVQPQTRLATSFVAPSGHPPVPVVWTAPPPSVAALDSLVPPQAEWFPPTCAPPDVTVVVRFLDGRREWLETALQSVLTQQGTMVEVIIVDDGSVRPLSPFDEPRVGLLRHAVNLGLGQARNHGAGLARGRWVTMLDYDDERLPGSLAQQIQDAEQVRATLALAGLQVMDVPGATDGQSAAIRWRWDGQPEHLREVLLTDHEPDNLVPCGALLWRRDRYPVAVPPDFGSCDDYAFVQQALLASRPEEVRFLDRPVYRYRLASPTSVRGASGPDALPYGPRRAQVTDYCVRKVPEYVHYLRLAQSLREPLRVAFVEKDLGMGGAQWQIALLAAAADRRVMQFRFLCEHDTPLARWLQQRGHTVHMKPADSPMTDWLQREVDAWRPDVLDSAWYPHATLLRGQVDCAMAVHAAGMKLWWQQKDKQTANALDAVVCVAQAIADAYPEWGNRAVVIPNAVDVEMFRAASHLRPAARAVLGVPPDAVVIGFCARMTASEKRTDILRRLIQRMHAERPEVWWLVAGHFSEHMPNHASVADEWRQFIAGQPVRWIETMSPWQAPAFHAAEDLYLCCSDSEGLSLAVLEAMAAGAPVVSTACGGHAEAVDDAVGRLVAIGDEEALYRSLRELIDLPADQRRAMGLFARHVCAGKYHIAENARKHALAYAALAKRV